MNSDHEATAKALADKIIRNHVHPDTGCIVDWEQIEMLIAAALAAVEANAHVDCPIDQMSAELAQLRASLENWKQVAFENDQAKGCAEEERDAAYVKGLERAKDIVNRLEYGVDPYDALTDELDAIQGEIDKAKK